MADLDRLPHPTCDPMAGEWSGRPRTTRAILCLIVLTAAVLRLVALGDTPPGLHQDEAANAWNAYCLLETGQDQVGERWPVFYSRCLGANRSTLYLYALIPFQAIGGLNVWTTRLPSAVGGILTVLLIYYVGTLLFGRATGLLAAGLLTFNPWHIQLSRWGHEAGLCPLLVLAPLALLLRSGLPIGGQRNRTPSVRLAAAAGCLAGLCCYGYPAVRLFLPAFLGATVVLTWKAWRDALSTTAGRRAVAAAAMGAALTFGPLAWFHIAHPKDIARRADQVWVWDVDDGAATKAAKVLGRYPGHFGLDFLFVSGDPFEIQSPPGGGQFHWYALPLMLGGAWTVMRRLRSSGSARLLTAWVLLYPVGDVLFRADGMHALRSFPGIGGLVLLSAVGAASLGSWLAHRSRGLRVGATCAMVVAVAALGGRQIHRYFGEYGRRTEVHHRFHVDLLEACVWLRPRLDDYDAVFVTGRGFVHPYIITLVGLQYDPRRWSADSPVGLAAPERDWDVYFAYGKMHFVFENAGMAPLKALRENDRPDRVLLIVRPGALGVDQPIHIIRGPQGEERLWIVEQTV